MTLISQMRKQAPGDKVIPSRAQVMNGRDLNFIPLLLSARCTMGSEPLLPALSLSEELIASALWVAKFLAVPFISWGNPKKLPDVGGCKMGK